MPTSIRVKDKTKKRLGKMKLFPQESYDETLTRLMNYVDEDDNISSQTKKDIKKAMAEIKKGKFITHEEVKRKLGIR